jgi:DNA-binding response OmpR family regulator
MQESKPPFAGGAAIASANPFAQSANPFARPKRIVCVDDVPMCRRLIEILLTRRGHEVVTLEDGSVALEWLARPDATCDLLITDHQMPRLSGLSLVRALRALEFASPIVVVSAALDPAVSAGYRALRVDAIMPKPIDTIAFVSAIDAILRNHQR